MRLGQIPGNSGMGWGTGWAAGLGRSLLSRPPAIGVPCRKLLPVKRSPGQKARRLKDPIPLKRFAPQARRRTGYRCLGAPLFFIFRITGSTPVPRHVRKQHAEAAEPGNPGEDQPRADKGGQPEERMPEGTADDADEHQGTGRDLNLTEQRDG